VKEYKINICKYVLVTEVLLTCRYAVLPYPLMAKVTK